MCGWGLRRTRRCRIIAVEIINKMIHAATDDIFSALKLIDQMVSPRSVQSAESQNPDALQLRRHHGPLAF